MVMAMFSFRSHMYIFITNMYANLNLNNIQIYRYFRINFK